MPANDGTTQAIAHGVVNALGAAGLLQPQAAQAPAAAAAGLLQQGDGGPPPAQPKPAHVQGDDLYLTGNLTAISKVVAPPPPYKVFGYILTFGGTPTSAGDEYSLSFPPNDPMFIPELDRLVTVMGTVNAANPSGANLGVRVYGSVDGVTGDNSYNVALTRLVVGWSGNSLAPAIVVG